MTRSIDRTLLISGLALFQAGLLFGLVVPLVQNPRAGLAAHLEGVMNGTFAIAVAAAWPAIHLGPRAAVATRWLLVVGTWINFIGTSASGMWGTSRMTPISGAGFTGPEWAERLVELCLMATLPTMVPALGLLLWGAVRARDNS